MYEDNFDDISRIKIVAVNQVDYDNGLIKAVVTTSHFGRVTTKPYSFTLAEWGEIVERGYIE